MILGRPGHEAVVDRTQSCAQVVYFSQDRGAYCWAHGNHPLSPQADCSLSNHGCNDPGTGRLGLCERHSLEIFG